MPDGSRTQMVVGELRTRYDSSIDRRFSESETRRPLALGIWSVLFMADMILVWRRLAGGFEDSVPLTVSVLSTILVACASWGAWVVLRSTQSAFREARLIHHVPPVISLLLTLAWVGAISASVSPFAFGLLIGVFTLQGAAVLAWESYSIAPVQAVSLGQENVGSVSRPARESQPNSLAALNSAHPVGVDAASWTSHIPQEDFEESAEVADDVTLWLSRRSVDTGELVEGWARAEFAGGQREVIVHIAFCPPLPLVPRIETEDLEGVGLQIRVAAAFPFGARLSVRRVNAVDDVQSYRVGFVATAVSVNRAA